jgi:hypothetical protein
MFCLTPIPAHQFDQLIDRSASMRKVMKNRGQLQPLIVPSPEQRADGLWREQVLLAADAVIIIAIDLLVEAGAGRAAIDHAMQNIQLEVISRLNDLDDGKAVQLAFAHDGKHYAVLSAPTTFDAIKAVTKYFVDRGVTDPAKLAFFCVPLRDAYVTARDRAKKHKIKYPERIWPTPDELKAGSNLLEAAIGPRTSPIIDRWRAHRMRRTAPIITQLRRD